MTKAPRVVVAMSGGVDSSLTAALLVEQGYEVIGVTMQIWPEDGEEHEKGGCCGLGAVFDARSVADQLGIPYYVMNFRELFRERVIDYFVREYARGRTPNPCIACNQSVKFEVLLRKARALGADYLATGHYARILADAAGRPRLARAVDARKDQSYALYGLTQGELSQIMLPLGQYTKAETRELARARGLVTADKPDSQEICFVTSGRYTDFLRQQIPERLVPGPIVDLSGRIVGQHQGLAAYTIGQRRGLGIAAEHPLYVVALDVERNAVVVGDQAALLCPALVAEAVSWVVERPALPLRVEAKIRYNGPAYPGWLESDPDDDERVIVRFDQPLRAVTPGQAVVFYEGDLVVGGGVIRTPLRERAAVSAEV